MGNVKIIVALRAILINNFQFVDQKQNTVHYIAVMCFGAWLLIFRRKEQFGNSAENAGLRWHMSVPIRYCFSWMPMTER